MQTPQIKWDHLNLQLNRSPRSTGLPNSTPTKTKIEIGYKADQIVRSQGIQIRPMKAQENSSNTNRQTSAKQNLEKLKQNRSQQIRSGQENYKIWLCQPGIECQFLITTTGSVAAICTSQEDTTKENQNSKEISQDTASLLSLLPNQLQLCPLTMFSKIGRFGI